MESRATARAGSRLAVWVANAAVLIGILVAVQGACATTALAAAHPGHANRGRRTMYVGVRRVASTASVPRRIYVGGRRVAASTASVHRSAAGYAELGRVQSAKIGTSPAPAPTKATASLTCANTNLVPTSTNISQVAAATLCLVNQQRAQHGEHPLRDNADLDMAATQCSQDMVADNYFGDTTPTGDTAMDRVLASGYIAHGDTALIGENIDLGALTNATPAAVVVAWMNSPPHRAAILNSDFLDSGIGIVPEIPAQYASGEASATYTQTFGAVEAPSGAIS
jgi:uncharacterized protein YkwD